MRLDRPGDSEDAPHAPERGARRSDAGSSRGRHRLASAALPLALILAVLGFVAFGSPPVSIAQAEELLFFRWGRSMRIADHELDLERGRLVVTLPRGGSVMVPLSIVARVMGPDGEVRFDTELAAVRRDPQEPADTVPWIPSGGWSGLETWDAWEGAPKWEFRWTEAPVASALVPAPPEGATEVELRLLSISHAIRALGGVAEPETQVVDVSLDGHSLGTLDLPHDGWNTHRLPLPAGGAFRETVVLRVRTAYQARPVTFAAGASGDRRSLGVALDYVRWCPCP